MGAVNYIISFCNRFGNWSKKICFDYAGDDTVFIMGSGRSGTSWLANICNYKNTFRYMFEPLNPSTVIGEDSNSHWCLEANSQHAYLDRVLTGSASNSWINSRNKRIFARRRLIKEIRSNLMLDWLYLNYPNLKVVLILRNPLAVAASRKTLSGLSDGSRWEWRPSLSELLDDTCLRDKLTTDEYNVLLAQTGAGMVMETIADWCINNLVATRSIDLTRLHLVYYEDLVLMPKVSIPRLMAYIDVDIDDELFIIAQRRSETSRPITQRDQGNRPMSTLDHWQMQLSNEELEQANELLSLFGIERFYSKNWQPNYTHATGDGDTQCVKF